MTREADRDALLARAIEQSDAGEHAEALVLAEQCLAVTPGWMPARGVRALALVELGRAREALEEVRDLARLQPDASGLLDEVAARCERALASEAGPRVRDEGPRQVVRVTSRGGKAPRALAEAWAAHLHAALDRQVRPRLAATRAPPTAEGEPGGPAHEIDVQRGTRILGRVLVTAVAGSPDEVVIEAAAPDARASAPLLVGVVLSLGVVGALAAFGLWIHFCGVAWPRVWNRISSFDGPGPGRASKLEVFWLLLGWGVGPLFTYMGFAALAGWIGRVAQRLRARQLRSQAGDALEAIVRSIVAAVQVEADRDPAVRAALGLD